MGTETQFWFQRPWDKIYKNDSPKIFFKNTLKKKKEKEEKEKRNISIVLKTYHFLKLRNQFYS